MIIVTHDLGGGAAHLAPDAGDEGRPRHRVRPHRPRARRPAGRLHPAPRLLDPAGVIRPWPPSPAAILPSPASTKTFTMHLQGGRGCPCCAGSPSRCAPASASRSAVPRARARARCSRWSTATTPPSRGSIVLRPGRRSSRRHRRRRPAPGARRPPRHDGLRQPVPALRAARGPPCKSSPSRSSSAASPAARHASERRELLTRLAHPRTAVEPAAGHLLRRRAAAGQHRARLRHRAAAAAAGRAAPPRSTRATATSSPS